MTTVRQPLARMGTLAAETVVKRIALESSTQHEVSVEPDWSCASTAPPPE